MTELAQFDFTDWGDWIVILVVAGGSILSWITKFFKDRAERIRREGKSPRSMDSSRSRPESARPDVPVARPRTTPGASRPSEFAGHPRPIGSNLPEPSLIRAPRPVAVPPRPIHSQAEDRAVVVNRSLEAQPPTTADADPLPSERRITDVPPRPTSKRQTPSPSRQRRPSIPPSLKHLGQHEPALTEPRNRVGTSSPDGEDQPTAAASLDEASAYSIRPTRAALRRAIVMNEILSPPLSLRNPAGANNL